MQINHTSRCNYISNILKQNTKYLPLKNVFQKMLKYVEKQNTKVLIEIV